MQPSLVLACLVGFSGVVFALSTTMDSGGASTSGAGGNLAVDAALRTCAASVANVAKDAN